ncbi:MAG: magnesium/cobalt transporter CorA [Thermodesulfobacteriota bacterium]
MTMPRFTKKTSKIAGSSPGTLVHIGEAGKDAVRISVMCYHSSEVREYEAVSIRDALRHEDFSGSVWIHVEGVHDLSVIEQVGTVFNIHPLTLEDIVSTGQRPKFEDYGTYVYVVMKMLSFRETERLIIGEQISLLVGNRFLVSFQETKSDIFNPIRERIRKGRGRIRDGGSDYLAYALVDAIVDHYFVTLERIGEKIELLETELLENPTNTTIQTIHEMKRETIFLRRQIWPLREVVHQLAKGETDLIQKETHVFLQDVYDHTVHILDTIESFRDILSGMIDLYLSTISNRTNEVMKVLTMIATIFIPVTFIAGVYGMNFKHMPELDWTYGYAMAWLLMAVIVLVIVMYFKRNKWM